MVVRALVLDFDGVIFDSAPECFAVALRAYEELTPSSNLAGRERDALFSEFLELMPLGNRAEDFGTALAALDDGRRPSNQTEYDGYRAARGTEWLERYHEAFYRIRYDWAEKKPREWQKLTRPYPPFIETLRRHQESTPYAIATSKDRRSVETLLEAYRLSDLFPPGRILDKETGPDKAVHLRQLCERMSLDLAEAVFMDDKVNHLDRVATLGVRCALAGWGYNGLREHELARQRGYTVCRLDDVEMRLFAGG